MIQALQVFRYNSNQVRTTDIDGEVWFVAKDVADILEIRDAFNATMHLDDDEKGTAKIRTPGGIQNMTIINEPGLYTLLMRSNKPEAKPFRRWVTHEVLPAIRKTGSYNAPGTEPLNVRVRVAEVLQRLALQVSTKAEREEICREAYKYATGHELVKSEPAVKGSRSPRFWTAQQIGALLKWPSDAVMHRAEKLGITKNAANGFWDGDKWSFSKEGRRKFLELVKDGIVKIEDGLAYYEGGYRRIYWRFEA